MTQDSDPSVLLEVVNHDFLDVLGGDGVALAVDGPLGHDDDVQPLAVVSAFHKLSAKLLWPVDFWRPLRNEDIVSLGHYAGHQGQVSAVAAHDFHDKGTLVRAGGIPNGINGLDDPM